MFIFTYIPYEPKGALLYIPLQGCISALSADFEIDDNLCEALLRTRVSPLALPKVAIP